MDARHAKALLIEGSSMAEGDKAHAVLALLQCSMPEYYALLDAAIDDPDADGPVVERLRADRERRSQAGETTPLLGVPT